MKERDDTGENPDAVLRALRRMRQSMPENGRNEQARGARAEATETLVAEAPDAVETAPMLLSEHTVGPENEADDSLNNQATTEEATKAASEMAPETASAPEAETANAPAPETSSAAASETASAMALETATETAADATVDSPNNVSSAVPEVVAAEAAAEPAGTPNDSGTAAAEPMVAEREEASASEGATPAPRQTRQSPGSLFAPLNRDPVTELGLSRAPRTPAKKAKPAETAAPAATEPAADKRAEPGWASASDERSMAGDAFLFDADPSPVRTPKTPEAAAAKAQAVDSKPDAGAATGAEAGDDEKIVPLPLGDAASDMAGEPASGDADLAARGGRDAAGPRRTAAGRHDAEAEDVAMSALRREAAQPRRTKRSLPFVGNLSLDKLPLKLPVSLPTTMSPTTMSPMMQRGALAAGVAGVAILVLSLFGGSSSAPTTELAPLLEKVAALEERLAAADAEADAVQAQAVAEAEARERRLAEEIETLRGALENARNDVNRGAAADAARQATMERELSQLRAAYRDQAEALDETRAALEVAQEKADTVAADVAALGAAAQASPAPPSFAPIAFGASPTEDGEGGAETGLLGGSLGIGGSVSSGVSIGTAAAPSTGNAPLRGPAAPGTPAPGQPTTAADGTGASGVAPAGLAAGAPASVPAPVPAHATQPQQVAALLSAPRPSRPSAPAPRPAASAPVPTPAAVSGATSDDAGTAAEDNTLGAAATSGVTVGGGNTRGSVYLQAGVFTRLSFGYRLRDNLRNAGIPAEALASTFAGKEALRVRVGPLEDDESRTAALTKLRSLGVYDAMPVSR
ncbi:MAG: SPOR domain-containing protein [Pseudomonadota bacterium]